MNNSILYLTLKSAYFDMIASGDKKEEYRDIKPFWVKRLCNEHIGSMGGDFMDKHKVIAYTFKPFTHVLFARGGHFHPSIPQMTLELIKIEIGIGCVNWGAEDGKEYFVIKLGKILNKS
jgi:hypothetical protein